MTLSIVMACAAPVIFGTFVICLLFRGQDYEFRWALRLLKLGFGWGLGMGLWSVLTYVAMRFQLSTKIWEALEIAVVSGPLVYWLLSGYRSGRFQNVTERETGLRAPWSIIEVVTTTIFVISLVIGSALMVIQSLNHPHGGWDAWAFWNLRASFFLKTYPDWMSAFDTGFVNYNLDYPLLIPCLAFRMWIVSGIDTAIVPAWIGFGFTISAVFTLVGALWKMVGMTQGMVAGICLITTKMFVVSGADQCSDAPLAFFLLSSVVAISLGMFDTKNLRSYLILGGIFLGFGIWTKNEGQLLSLALLTAVCLCLVVRYKSISWVSAGWILVGLAPMLAVVSDFKINVTPMSNAYVSYDYAPRIFRQIFEMERYLYISKRFLMEFLTFHRWGFAGIFLILYAALKGFNRSVIMRPATCMCLTTIALTTAGYFMIYVITPSDLALHIDTSLSRLMLHIFPLSLFVFFLNTNELTR